MKFTAQASVLANVVTLAATAMRKNALARVVTVDDGVSIACCDRHIAISAKAAATVLEPGAVALSADRLGALTSGFAAGAIVTMSTGDSTALITCGNSRSRLPIFPPADLPDVLTIGEDEIASIAIRGANCLRLLEPLSAAAGDMTRFYLCGLFLHSVDGKLVAVSTDGARLIRVAISTEDFSITRDLILPAEAAMVLRRLVMRTRAELVTLRRSKRLFAVTGPDFEFTSRLIDYSFPHYERAIPSTAPNSVSVDRIGLLAAMSRLAAVATADPPLVALSWSDAGQLDIFLARQPDDGADAINAAQCNGIAKIASPLSQFAAMIAELKCERVRLEAAGPLVIGGEGEKLALIMPSAWTFRDGETADSA